MRRRMAAGFAGVLASLLIASTAFGFECTNASKPPAAGIQVLIDGQTGELVWTTPGVANRIEQGLVDPNTGEGFHGLVGIDVDGDREADFSIYFVGPDGEIPLEAQFNGPACRGITNIETLLTECL